MWQHFISEKKSRKSIVATNVGDFWVKFMAAYFNPSFLLIRLAAVQNWWLYSYAIILRLGSWPETFLINFLFFRHLLK